MHTVTSSTSRSARTARLRAASLCAALALPLATVARGEAVATSATVAPPEAPAQHGGGSPAKDETTARGQSSAATQPSALRIEDDDVAARGFDTVITWRELDRVFCSRRAMSKDGRGALRHLVDSRLLEISGREFGIRPSDKEIDARLDEIDRQIRASGDPAGIATYLKKARLDLPGFRYFLRLSIVQETLTRRALGLKNSAPINAEQQQLWMEERLRDRGYTEVPPPWRDGVVARASDFSIELPEFLRYLRQRLPERDVREDCYQLLLQKRMEKRMPDLSAERVKKYVDEEIDRRRRDAQADPRYAGISFEQLLAAQGIVADTLPDDPSVRAAALSRLWVDRSYDDDALKQVYSAERAYFDGLYGEAVETRMLFLRGAEFKNEFNPRSFKEAEAALSALKAEIRSPADFARVAMERSEDATTREHGGDLGLIAAGSARIPEEIRAEVQRFLAEHADRGASDTELQVVGPVKLSTGFALLSFGARRPPPAWDVMAGHVHRELRKRFIDEVLPRSNVVTAFEAP